MTGEEFVKNCYKEKDNMLKMYFDKALETSVGEKIKSIEEQGISEEEVRSLVDSVLKEAFYSLLLGLEGEASLGTSQEIYKIYDEEDNLIEDIEGYAFDAFMSEE